MKRILFSLILVLLASAAFGVWHIDEGFEDINTLPDGWTTFDDGDGMIWRNISHANAHTGSRAAVCDNYFPNQNADWMVTPMISVAPGDSLIFYTRAWISTENLKVYVSNSVPTPAWLTHLLVHITDISTTYQRVAVSLESWANQDIYLGFYWECESYGILVDDIKVGQPQIVIPELNLPASISFFQSEGYELDLTPYIVCTDPAQANVSAEANPDLEISIQNLNLSIAATDFVGSTQLNLTLTDLLTDQTASASLEVEVLADPAVDLCLGAVISPRENEYLGMPFIPKVEVMNCGVVNFADQLQISLQVYAEGNLLHQDTAYQNLVLAPGESDFISFNAEFSPAVEANHEFVFTIETPDDNEANNQISFDCNVVNRITMGGPDAFGYRFVDSNNPLGPEYNWIDISQTGTSTVTFNVSGWGGDDNFSEPIPLGFNFPFYGSVYSSAYVDINGEILLAENNWYDPYPNYGWDNDGNMFNYAYPIPGFQAMPGLIAVYWDDLYAEQGTGDVYFEHFGEAPNRYTIFQWQNLRYYAGTGGIDQLRFQVILHENGEIKMQYHTVETGQSGSNAPHNNGLSATIALQNETADAGIVYLREIVQNSQYQGVEPAGNLLHPELAILFYTGEDHEVPIISHSPVGNTLHRELELTAKIMDMSELQSKNLHYNTGAGWQVISPTSSYQNDYRYHLSNLEAGSTFEYYFEATDVHGNSACLPENAPAESFSLKILPGDTAQVLIAYSGNQDYQRIELPVYEAILTELDIDYDIFDWEEHQNYSLPAQYQGIIAYANSGTASDNMYYFADALCQYLDLGTEENPKNLWFASDGLAGNQHAQPNSSSIRRLLNGYMRTSYVPTGFGGGTNGLAGPNSFQYEHGTILALPNTQVGTVNTEYPVYANSPDCIYPNHDATDTYWDLVPYPEIGAIYTYAFEGGPINGQAYLYHGVAATQVQTPSFNTMYFSFDFSQLTNPLHRLEWMQDLMDWWDLEPVSTQDSQIPAQSMGIQSIYPNPFNPETTIRYHLATAGKTEMAVYNLKGQRVKTLVNESKAAGTHNVVFNGLDDAGRPISSGIYFVKIQTSNLSQTRKITIIK